MQKKAKQPASHAESVARRAFIKRAALGAMFAVPAVESLTKSDILVKSALAATGTVLLVHHWTLTTQVSGPARALSFGSITPPGPVDVTDGNSQSFTITAGNGYRIASVTDNGTPVFITNDTTMTYTMSSIRADHLLVAIFTSVT